MRAVTADRAQRLGSTSAGLRRAALTATLAVLVGWVSVASLEGSDVVRLVPPGQHVGPPPASSTPFLKQKADKVAKNDPRKNNDKKASDKGKVAFSMDGKKWESVFKWLGDTTGKEIYAPNKPTGTFTFKSPP